MGKRLYVGNLPYSIDDQALQAKFEEIGAVSSAKVITDRDTGRSKGFGFVEMPNDDEAVKAIEKLNGQPLDGRNMNVSEARPQGSGNGGRGGGRGGFRGGDRGDRGGRGDRGDRGSRY